jgi:uncharacterized protein YigA (DUF484 family)
MQEDDIKQYLKTHPNFFELNASLLADIRLPNPHGGAAISLAERQQLAQRDKINALEARFSALLKNAHENERIANKVHVINLQFHLVKSLDALLQLVSAEMTEHFGLSDSFIRIWATPSDAQDASNAVFNALNTDAKEWIANRTEPYCGEPPSIASADWFLQPAASLAIIPLHQAHEKIGFLALASTDATRFTAEMGTDFLSKIGEIISAALSRFIE